MRFSVRVYCARSPDPTRADLARFVEDGAYLDPDPRFAPDPADPAALRADWDQLCRPVPSRDHDGSSAISPPVLG